MHVCVAVIVVSGSSVPKTPTSSTSAPKPKTSTSGAHAPIEPVVQAIVESPRQLTPALTPSQTTNGKHRIMF